MLRLPTSEDDENPRHPRDPRRRLLRPKEWLPLAALAPRLPAVGDRLLVVQEMAHRRDLLERLNAALREVLRARSGRNPPQSAGIADSQSAKTTEVGTEQRGYDGNK